ncbi:MAG: WS/DGAT/MGAT family O-acyltransferase [Acidimicrobiales bacterium]
MGLMPVTDAAFLLAERRERPMHVGGLQLFAPPDDVHPSYVGDLVRESLDVLPDDIHPLFRRRPFRSLGTFGQWFWNDDAEIDLEYHVRHSALPPPGRIRELLALVSQLHGSLLDRNRPLWEGHLIEGLDDGRFAVYTKIHHAMVDGVAAMQILQDALTDDPDARDVPPPWAMKRRGSRRTVVPPSPVQVALGALRGAGQLAGVGPVFWRTVREAQREQAATIPFQAPRTIFNQSITGARRFAAQSWPLERVKAIGKASGTSLNDVVLAMCSGALRQYLLELDALPDQPLVSMVPVSLRTADDDARDAGNAVGVILCNLATDLDDAGQRLKMINESMAHGKSTLKQLSPLQVVALSAMAMTPMIAAPLYGPGRVLPPPFNLVISNVPGPRKPLYWNGARLEGVYPVSIPSDGQALNITVTSYVNNLEFGLIGCRQKVPHLQRLLAMLGESLDDLEQAVGIA